MLLPSAVLSFIYNVTFLPIGRPEAVCLRLIATLFSVQNLQDLFHGLLIDAEFYGNVFYRPSSFSESTDLSAVDAYCNFFCLRFLLRAAGAANFFSCGASGRSARIRTPENKFRRSTSCFSLLSRFTPQTGSSFSIRSTASRNVISRSIYFTFPFSRYYSLASRFGSYSWQLPSKITCMIPSLQGSSNGALCLYLQESQRRFCSVTSFLVVVFSPP